MKNLKPVTFIKGQGYHAQNTTQQKMLLSALRVTSDPQRLKEMIGVKTVAEVYRTLDKLAIRREYHKALGKYGVDFDFLVKGLKTIAEQAEHDGDRLKALQIFLKSVGLDKYESDTTGGGSWEDVLVKKIEESKAKDGTIPATNTPVLYDVKQPIMPEHVKAQKLEEIKIGKEIYE